jgi:hypothetical protein
MSTVTYWRLALVGTLIANGDRKVGRVLKVVVASAHGLVTTEMSTPPPIEAVLTKNVMVALLICAEVSPGGSCDRSNWISAELPPPMLMTVAVPKLFAGRFWLT